MARRIKTEAERFWPKVNKEGPVPAHRPELGPCWVWQAALNNKGYGMFSRAPVPGKRTAPLVLAHRWAYEQMTGPVPDGLELDHLCRIPACRNPYHAEPAT